MGRCQNVTFANYRLKECQAGVGKRPRKTRASYCIDLTPLQPTPSLHSHCTASLLTQCCATQCAFVRQHLDAARGHLRLRRLFSTPAVSVSAPAGYKAFSNQRQLLSDQDCLRQRRPDAVNHGCADSPW